MENKDLNAFFEFLSFCFDKISELVKFCLEKLKAENTTCDPALLLVILFIITFYLGSLFWAISIAKARRHKAKLHAVLAFIFPWIYPLYLLLTLQIGIRAVPQPAGEDKKEDDDELARKLAEARQESPEEKAKREAEEASLREMKKYEAMARKEDGTPAGPWKVRFKNTDVHVRQILEALPEVVSVEIEENGEIRKMRLRYELIESWEEA